MVKDFVQVRKSLQFQWLVIMGLFVLTQYQCPSFSIHKSRIIGD